jgi:hypothetical protein
METSTENEWIDINLNNIAEKGNMNIKFINRNNRSANVIQVEDIIEKFREEGLAKLIPVGGELTERGEEIYKFGGWLKWKENEKEQNRIYEDERKKRNELETELAKSNIEANKLNEEIAKQNKKDKRSNKIAMWINIFIGIINLAAIIWQLSKSE